MAPTICSEKDYRVRGRVQRQSNINNYDGKITHRRSIAARNAKSMKFSLVNAFENEAEMFNNDDDSDSNDYQNSISSRSSPNLIKHENPDTTDDDSNHSNHNEFYWHYYNNMRSNLAPTFSIFNTENRSGYLCHPQHHHHHHHQQQQQRQSKFIYCQYSASRFNGNCSSGSESTAVTSTIQETESLLPSTVQNDKTNQNEAQIRKIFAQKFLNHNNNNYSNNNNHHQNKRNNNNNTGGGSAGSEASNTRGLVEIALKTITLIRRNQLLQRKLLQLQVETKEFIESVMANPENRALCNKQIIEQPLLSSSPSSTLSTSTLSTSTSSSSSPSSTSSLGSQNKQKNISICSDSSC